VNEYTAIALIVLGFMAFVGVIFIATCWALVALIGAMLKSIN